MPRRTNLPKRIITFISQNPSATREDISQNLDVSYQSVQKQLKKMEEDGTVLTGFLITSKWAKAYKKFWIFVETCYPKNITEDQERPNLYYQENLCKTMANKLKNDNEYSAHISLGEIQILLGGNWDILLSLYAEEAESIGRFVTRFLRTRPEIIKTSTSWSLLFDLNEKETMSPL